MHLWYANWGQNISLRRRRRFEAVRTMETSPNSNTYFSHARRSFVNRVIVNHYYHKVRIISASAIAISYLTSLFSRVSTIVYRKNTGAYKYEESEDGGKGIGDGMLRITVAHAIAQPNGRSRRRCYCAHASWRVPGNWLLRTPRNEGDTATVVIIIASSGKNRACNFLRQIREKRVALFSYYLENQ